MSDNEFRAWAGEEMIDENYTDDHYILAIEDYKLMVFEWHDGDYAEYCSSGHRPPCEP